MSLSTLQGLSTVLVMIAFLGVCWWAFSPKRKKKFEEAANLPFLDDELSPQKNDGQVNDEKEHVQPEK